MKSRAIPGQVRRPGALLSGWSCLSHIARRAAPSRPDPGTSQIAIQRGEEHSQNAEFVLTQ